MTGRRQRLARLERGQLRGHQWQHELRDGWALIHCAGKVVVALPDNGRDHHA